MRVEIFSLGVAVALFFGCASSSDVDDGESKESASSHAGRGAKDAKDAAAGDSEDTADAKPEPTPAPAKPGSDSSAQPPAPTRTATMPQPGQPLAKDECGLNSGYPGDEYCILPPPPDKGFQLHIGPTDYKNVDPRYIMPPGGESTDDFRTTSGNDKKQFFYYRQFRMRPGSHHNIVSLTTGGGFGMGRRIGTSNALAEDSPKGAIIAPENEGVGIAIDPKVPINVSLHSNNFTENPYLREVWINFWYKDPSEVTEQVSQLFQTGDVRFSVQPHEEKILGPYRCTINGNGRMLWFYGHRHANNVRFSAWRNRGQQRDLFYEGLHWEEPIVLEYSSTVMNRTPDREKGVEGGWSGILDMKAGDVLEWECHVVNKTDGVLRFANETYTAEMCIMDAELVGANCGAI